MTNRLTTSPQGIIDLVNEFERNRLYGSIEIKFESGRVVLIRKIENIKTEDRRDDRGTCDGQK